MARSMQEVASPPHRQQQQLEICLRSTPCDNLRATLLCRICVQQQAAHNHCAATSSNTRRPQQTLGRVVGGATATHLREQCNMQVALSCAHITPATVCV